MALRSVLKTLLITVTKNTWKDLPSWMEGQRLILICRSVTSGNTATVTVWGSDDDGTNYFPIGDARIAQEAKALAVAVGTGRIGTGAYVTTLFLLACEARRIYIQESSPGTDDFVYQIGCF